MAKKKKPVKKDIVPRLLPPDHQMFSEGWTVSLHRKKSVAKKRPTRKKR